MFHFLISVHQRKIPFSFLRHVRCFKCLKKTRLSLSSYAKNKEPAWKDVTLYYYNRQKFFRLVGLACASQFIFWGWMAYILISLKQERSQKKILDVSSSSSNPGVSWKIARFVMDSPVMLASFAVGVGLVFTTSGFIYSLRSVNRLVLQGNNLRVVTHTPLGGTRSVTVPISDVSCTGSRIGAKPQVPLKLKGHRFFFLLDKEGEFVQPTLFDKTVGIKRF
ncbi:transmembrane protein 223-like isoform X3 [Orbicella faveolata]|uniref:transmembrane protein 223-like isoform X2 n=1 Tax=Orbicella faveolata TaxID=48498 RepID=UPI0009E60FB6|nr:transmembrane protein 223-like isoform X2 [Orbicella faveolata]XP_020603615.1 transmembrane protein 223-like isoform X3 [Orbicella faveolata]